MPANRHQIYGDMPLQEALARAEHEGREGLSTTTQRSYLGALTGILDHAVNKRLMSSNPAKGLKPLQRETVPADQRTLAFSNEQLRAFFTSKYYRACAASGPEPFRHDPKGWRFWLPLISLFTGARPNEICQLELRDVQQTEAGNLFFDISAETDVEQKNEGKVETRTPKRLKTRTSRRKIPVHPELIRCGLLQYCEARRNRRETRLFPSLEADRAGYFSSYPLKRFRETFLKQAIHLKERQSF